MPPLLTQCVQILGRCVVCIWQMHRKSDVRSHVRSTLYTVNTLLLSSSLVSTLISHTENISDRKTIGAKEVLDICTRSIKYLDLLQSIFAKGKCFAHRGHIWQQDCMSLRSSWPNHTKPFEGNVVNISNLLQSILFQRKIVFALECCQACQLFRSPLTSQLSLFVLPTTIQQVN